MGNESANFQQLFGKHQVTIDERLPVGIYIRRILRTVDGRVWAALCLATVLCGLDLLAGTNLIPMRDAAKPTKATVLLAFTPLLVFLAMVSLRQLPFASTSLAAWIRAALCIAFFLIINF